VYRCQPVLQAATTATSLSVSLHSLSLSPALFAAAQLTPRLSPIGWRAWRQGRPRRRGPRGSGGIRRSIQAEQQDLSSQEAEGMKGGGGGGCIRRVGGREVGSACQGKKRVRRKYESNCEYHDLSGQSGCMVISWIDD